MRWIRWVVYGISVVMGLAVWGLVWTLIPPSTLRMIRLTECFAFCAIIFLYLTLLISPLYGAFGSLPGKALMVKARQAVGISAFGFGLIHGTLAFFGLLGGFNGLGFLSEGYIVAISFSFTALLILATLAVTSIDRIHRRLGKWWKRLHRLVYVAAVLIMLHLLLLGTHFTDLSGIIPQTFLIAVMVLVFLEVWRVDRWIQKHYRQWPRVGLVFIAGSVTLAVIAFWLFGPVGGAPSLGIHAAHIQLAKQAAQGATQVSSIPGLTGDRTKRYSVNFTHPDTIAANQPVQLQFTVTDASNGIPVKAFATLYEKTSHLIIVDSQLQYFVHVHPTLDAPTFTIQTQFPHDGVYHLYLDFWPFGAIEQQFGFSVSVGNGQVVPATQPPDTQLTKTFGNYQVSMRFSSTPLKASQMSFGGQQLIFTLKDAQSKQPLANLQPYLGAYGHLVMINEQTYEYLHVHPNALATPGAPGGPDVAFLPIGIYGPIKPGVYRVFAQFNPDNNLFTADYTVKVE